MTDANTPLSLRDILRVLFKHQRPIVVVTGVALLTSTLVVFLMPPTYEATTHLLVRRSIEEAEAPSIVQNGRVGTTVVRQVSQADEVQTEIALIKSRDLVVKVIDAAGLTRESFDRVKDFRRYVRAAHLWIVEGYRLVVDEVKYFLHLSHRPTPEAVTEHKREIFVSDVAEALVAEQVPESDVLRVGFRCSDPKLAQTLANVLGEHAIIWHTDKYRQSGNVPFLQEQVEQAREQVEQAERELAEARSRLNLISIDDRRKLLVESQFRVRARLNEIAARRAATAAGRRQLSAVEHNQVLGAVRPQLLTRSAEKHALDAEEAEVQKQVVAYDWELAALNEHEHEIRGLERRMDSRAVAYTQLMNSLQQARTHDAKQHARIANVVTVQSAALPLEPVKPRKWFLILLSTGGGLLLVLAWVFLVEFNDSSFGSEAELRAALGAEVLGTIPRTRWGSPKEIGERRAQA